MASTIGELLQMAQNSLAASESRRLDAELLLAEVLGASRTTLLANPARPVAEEQRLRFHALLERRRRGEPVAYLLGRKGFWDFELRVDSRVLVPRPETELLVTHALAVLAGREAEPLQLVDLGTGSGAIAIALARHSPRWQVLATDFDPQALALAAANAAELGAPNVACLLSDWGSGLDGRRFDLAVSNPPYVAPGDPELQPAVLSHEPRQALFAERDGFAALEAIVGQAAGFLRPGGWLLLEHGHRQGAGVRELLSTGAYVQVETWQDLAGLDRVTAGRRPA